MIPTTLEGNVASDMFTATERRLLMVYRCGTVSETADILREAHRDIYDHDTLTAVDQLLIKLNDTDDFAFAAALECGDSYV